MLNSGADCSLELMTSEVNSRPKLFPPMHEVKSVRSDIAKSQLNQPYSLDSRVLAFSIKSNKQKDSRRRDFCIL